MCTFELGSLWVFVLVNIPVKEAILLSCWTSEISNKAVRLTFMFLLESVALRTLRIKFILLQTEEIDSEYLRDNRWEST